MDGNLRLGGFRVVSDLKSGVGSQGSVYKAVCEDDSFPGVAPGTVVALKVMPVQDAGKVLYSRLMERTGEIARIRHPNVVRYLGCFRETTAFNDLHVVVQEYLEGESLKDRLHRCPSGIDVDEALRIAGETLAGLEHVCSLGMVHRDIKPGNIFLCADGSVKLIDFEVSRQDGSAATTTGGNLIGTFDYMAPDFAKPDFRGDEISDIFSFGVCLHEMLTGRTPYRRLSSDDSQASFAFFSRWSRTEDWVNPVKISTRVNKILSGADAVLSMALQVERSERFASFSVFASAFRRIKFRELANGGEKWRLLTFVGRGGFGEVLKARELRTGRIVAIKHLLRSSYADRFRREAKVMAKLDGSCFVKFQSFFEMNIAGVDSAFIIMDFLEDMPGSSLRDEFKRSPGEPLQREMVIEAFLRYARGLATLHAKGMVHRDIKPSNLYFPKNSIGTAAIMDFGIARDVSGTESVGSVPGTLDYMPPEVAVDGSRGDSAMDVYALGLCLYEALSGKMAYPRLPDGSAGYREFFERAKNRTPPKLDTSAYRDEPKLVRLVEEMTNPDHSLRMKDAAAVADRLSSLFKRMRQQDDERKSEVFFSGSADDDAEEREQETVATVAPDEQMLAQLSREAKCLRRNSSRKTFLIAFVCAAALLAASGAWYWHRYAEKMRVAEAERRLAEAERISAERRRAKEKEIREAERLRKEQAEKDAQEKRLQEERRQKVEAQQKALDEALRRIETEKAAREAAELKALAERKAEEARKAAEVEKLKAEKERLRQEAERLAREKAEAEAKSRADELKRIAETERLKAAEEMRRKMAEEAKRKAAEESAKRKVALPRSKKMDPGGNPSAKAMALKNLAKVKAELDAYKVEYERKRAAALKPGSRENPNDLDREWYMRLRKYRQLKKKIDAMKE